MVLNNIYHEDVDESKKTKRLKTNGLIKESANGIKQSGSIKSPSVLSQNGTGTKRPTSNGKTSLYTAFKIHLKYYVLKFINYINKLLFVQKVHAENSKELLKNNVTSTRQKISRESFEQPALHTAIMTYLGFYILMFLGFINQFLFSPKVATEKNREGYVPLYDSFERFYLWYVYRRVRDCWNRPISSVPGAMVTVKERVTHDYGWTFEFTGREIPSLNLGSYNYLGFAESSGKCAEDSIKTIRKYGWATGSSRHELAHIAWISDDMIQKKLLVEAELLDIHGRLRWSGSVAYGIGWSRTKQGLLVIVVGVSQDKFESCRAMLRTISLHLELEELTARFLGVEAATVFGMGFATNSLNLPTLIDKECLVLSDEKNHASLILGLRLSGAVIRVFKHNNMNHLEKLLREGIVYGQPKSEKPWEKVLIVVEGVYSMEGSIVKLPEVLALKKKYKAYLYLDEAHSVGAMGPHGRGVVDYWGCNPRDVDILMGTFTKSFGSAGGYIAGSKDLINHIKANSHAACYASSMSPPIAQQIITSMKIIMGEDGTDEGARRIKQLRHNTRYFRKKLHQMGVIIYGNEDSPVIPMLVYLFSKIGAVVRGLAARKVATVGVGFPATPLMEGRIRFCLSAAHTKEQLDYAIKQIEEIAEELGLKHSRKPRSPLQVIYGADSDDEELALSES